MQAMAGVFTINGLLAITPEDLKDKIPREAVELVVLALTGIGMFGRNVQQQPVDGVPVKKETPPQ
jgi:hypothetical protein